MASAEARIKNSIAHKGINTWMQGRVPSLEVRTKISETHKRIRESKHNWKGGITTINMKIRKSLEYRLWREAVFSRDDFTCKECNARGIYLEADHIKPFAYFPDLRFDINNGRTLCKSCHRKTDTYGNKCWGKYNNNQPIYAN